MLSSTLQSTEEVLASDPATSRLQRYSVGDFLGLCGRLVQQHSKAVRGGRIRALNTVKAEVPPGDTKVLEGGTGGCAFFSSSFMFCLFLPLGS